MNSQRSSPSSSPSSSPPPLRLIAVPSLSLAVRNWWRRSSRRLIPECGMHTKYWVHAHTTNLLLYNANIGEGWWRRRRSTSHSAAPHHLRKELFRLFGLIHPQLSGEDSEGRWVWENAEWVGMPTSGRATWQHLLLPGHPSLLSPPSPPPSLPFRPEFVASHP